MFSRLLTLTLACSPPLSPAALSLCDCARYGATPVVAIILDDDHAQHMRIAAEEVKARGAKVTSPPPLLHTLLACLLFAALPEPQILDTHSPTLTHLLDVPNRPSTTNNRSS